MICVLQFDAASVAVLDRMLSEGRLPALAGLIARGRRTVLETPAAHFAAGAFHTLYSGVELADHGLFYPFQWDASAQRARYMTAFAAPPAIWERLARAGLRTLAIDPYESRPPTDREGTYVCGWQFADRVVLPRWSLPRGAAGALARRHGRGPHATEIFGRPTARELLALRAKLVAAPARVATVAADLLARERYDLVWLTFSAAHLAGHQFWDLSQLASSRPTPVPVGSGDCARLSRRGRAARSRGRCPTGRRSSSPPGSSCAGSTGRRRRRSPIPPTTRATSG